MQTASRYAALVILSVATGCEATAVSQNGGPTKSEPQGVVSKQPAAPPRTLDKSFDDIKFPIEKDEPFVRSMLTDNVKELFGKHIRIRGYMFPPYKRKGIQRFVLVRDNQECCFGPGAALYDCVRVTLRDGESVSFSTTPIAVEGQFKLDEFRDPEGAVRAVFHIEGAVVK